MSAALPMEGGGGAATGPKSPAVGDPAAVAAWLMACATCVFAVLVVGGITRLLHAGLSIVQWQPLVGAVPPLSASDWTALFAQYQDSPEFRVVNPGMTLAEFKPIFWWEYAHRLLGRLAGMLFLVPFLWFAATGRITRALGLRLGLLFALGGLQGALGWYMVRSGLVDDPRVSPLRLAAHLGMALLLIGLLLWTAWSLRRPAPAGVAVPASGRVAVGAVFLMALSGALMAGTHAGLAYNTFPLMGGTLLPPDLLRLDPWYRNFIENLATVHFLHRSLALLVAASVLAFCWRLHTAGAAHGRPGAGRAPLAALGLQIALGIATVLSGVALPLAAAHQAAAVLLYLCVLHGAFRLRALQ